MILIIKTVEPDGIVCERRLGKSAGVGRVSAQHSSEPSLEFRTGHAGDGCNRLPAQHDALRGEVKLRRIEHLQILPFIIGMR